MAPRWPQEGPKMAPRRLQDASKNELMFMPSKITAKSSLRGSRDPPKRPPDPPGTPPGGALEAPGPPPKASKTPPKSLHGLSKCKANVDLDVNVVVPVNGFSYLQQTEQTLTKPPEASGMRY